jgi:hypothetical protein
MISPLKTRQLKDYELQSKKMGAAARLSGFSPPSDVNHDGHLCYLRLRQYTFRVAVLLLPAGSVAVTVM